jgi:hypothetical protein
MPHLLVIVHPGSACGSADFNLGRYSARADREYLADDIAAWEGAVLVIDGFLSDELTNYPALNDSIKEALKKAKKAKLISSRQYGSDGEDRNQVVVAERFIKKHKLDPADWQIDLTGAWMTEDSGCVRSVMEVFNKAGYRTNVRDSALWDNSEEDETEEDPEDD